MITVCRFALLFLAVSFGAELTLLSDELYFPTKQGSWERVDADQAGWDQKKLDDALAWAGEVGSSGVVILFRGRILAERHWVPDTDKESGQQRYSWSVVGKTDDGHLIEDVASVQKSITSILVGIAQEKGLLRIDRPVSEYLGKGWSNACPPMQSPVTVWLPFRA